MENDALIFDIDGTLWNAVSVSTKSWNTGLKKLGITKEISIQEIESVTGNPYEKCVEILLPGFKNQYPELLKVLDECEATAVKNEGGIFYDGVINGIKKLAQAYKIFLVSNCQEWYMELLSAVQISDQYWPVLTATGCQDCQKTKC